MFRKFLLSIAGLLTLCTASALAQTTGNQTFTVNVPASVSITAPAAVALTHDQTDNPQAFPAQSWVVKGNTRNGVNVSFSVPTPFVHSTDPTFKRDAKLNLAVGNTQGPGTWNVTKATDTTDYINNDSDAQVTAASSGVGRADLNLTVTFVGGPYGLFAEGTYTTTVTGTVVAN